MSAIIDFARERARRTGCGRAAIRIGDKVRRLGELREGHVVDLFGGGGMTDSMVALVQFRYARERVPVSYLEPIDAPNCSPSPRGAA